MKFTAILLSLFLSSPVLATQSSGGFGISIIIRPTVNVVSSETAPNGIRYTIFTNMKKIFVNGKEYTFATIGEHVIFVPGKEFVVTY